MALGYVLIFWILPFFVAIALLVAPVLGLWSWLNSKRVQQPSVLRALKASLLPFAWIFTGIAWFVIQGLLCEVRGVDPGLGDYWLVPVQDGYYFCMIDVTDEGHLARDGCSGVSPVDGINKLAESGNFIVGTKADTSAFSLNTRNGIVKHYRDIVELTSRFSGLPPLQSPIEFYADRRWGYQDFVSVIMLGVALILVTCVWYRAFIGLESRSI